MVTPRWIKVKSRTVVIELDQPALEKLVTLANVAEEYVKEHFAGNIRNIPDEKATIGTFTLDQIRQVVPLIDEIYEL